jgi:hypothetical protein
MPNWLKALTVVVMLALPSFALAGEGHRDAPVPFPALHDQGEFKQHDAAYMVCRTPEVAAELAPLVREEFVQQFMIASMAGLCLQTPIPIPIWIDTVEWCGKDNDGANLCVVGVHNEMGEKAYGWYIGTRKEIESRFPLKESGAQDVWRPSLWTPRPLGHIDLWVLDDETFEARAVAYGQEPTIGAFATWGTLNQAIFTRTSTTHLIGHELRHIDERRDFHAGRSGARSGPID